MTTQQAYSYAETILGLPQLKANGKIYWTHDGNREIAYCENCKFISFRKKMMSIYVHFNDTFEVDFNKAKTWYNET